MSTQSAEESIHTPTLFAQGDIDRVSMNFFKMIFSAPSRSTSKFYSFPVKCDRCGEVVEGRINLDNDPSVVYEGDSPEFFVRKVLMGNGLCFQRMEVELKFDATGKLLEKHSTGGQFMESK